MKTIIIGILLSLCVVQESYAEQPKINLHLNYRTEEDKRQQRRGVKMMIVGTAFLATGVIMDENFKRNGAYRADYPYNQWAAVSAQACEAVGLLMFVGGLSNVLTIKF